MALTLLLASCSEPGTPAKKSKQISPEQLLAKLRSTYAGMKSYSDNAVVVERGVSRSRGTVTEIPYSRTSLLFERPNRYAISYEHGVASSQGSDQYRVACDGQRVRSSASELPEQIHEAVAPIVLTTDNLIPDPELRQAILQVAMENLFPQIALLLKADIEKPIFPRATRMELLPESNIGEAQCHRLALTESEGTRVLWIDKSKCILRRMELPIDNQREQMDPTGQYKTFSVDMDFENVVIDAEFDDAAVTIPVPAGGRLVRRFIPPPPVGPSVDLGKPVKEFTFTDASGAKVSSASLAGKVTIFDFWATDCAPCKQHTPTLEAAYQQLKSEENIAFYGVSTDPKGLSNQSVEKTLQAWGATFPLLRDLDKNAYYNLKVQATPTLMLLDPQGRLQAFHVGLLEGPSELVRKVRQVRGGEDLLQQAKADHARELDEYLAILDAATIEDSLIESGSSPSEIAPRKLPENLRAEKLWQSKLADLGDPGDVALSTGAQSENQEILVLDGGEAIVRFDRGGNMTGRTVLPTHAENKNGFIRLAIDAEGKQRYLASGIGWQQIFLYDQVWKFLFAFPDEKHSGIGDARFLITDSTGRPDMFVGYLGGRGVQRGNLDGQSIWFNRHLDHVLQVVTGPISESDERSVWCTSTRGTIFQISADGKLQREFPVVGHTMVSLEPQPVEGEQLHCGISQMESRQYSLVAFDTQGEVSWSYELPQGEYAEQIPPIQMLKLPTSGACHLVAAPDSSLHFISLKGELIDRFDYGDQIQGLAADSSEDGTFLWVSAGNRLTAWRITENSAP
jgi:thiol-disulfide isomerase/thioredoxin/outer membrane lipoprotein-sorting protein